MDFSGVGILFYVLPIALVLYYTVGRISIHLRNLILLLASLAFYAWGEAGGAALLLASCALNWAIGLLLGRCRKKALLVSACVVNLGILFVFKYWDFVMTSLNDLLGRDLLPVLHVAFPIGISFFTLRALSYLVDVYRGDTPAQRNPISLWLYISMFPQLVAGPIVPYHTVEQQLLHRGHTWERFSEGTARFVQGFAKKLLLANTFAVLADNIFLMTRAGHQVVTIPVCMAWLGALAFTLQIFLELSAYSDMAIGLGRMFGFQFEENFRYPYTAQSVGEFWRRWNISLGSWFRDYVYAPLGDTEESSVDRMARNMLIVWILIGLWHGASWNALLWGFLTFLFLLAEQFASLDKRPGSPWRHIYTVAVVSLGWVLLRCEDFYQLQEYMGNLFGAYHNSFFGPSVWMLLREYAVAWAAGILVCVPMAPALRRRLLAKCPQLYPVLYAAGMTVLLLISILYAVGSGSNPPIYFNV